MHKSTTSLLLAALLAASGFAVAQNDVRSGTQGGSGPTSGANANTRADVNVQNDPAGNKSGTQGGAGPERGAPTGSSGDVMPNSRADVKAQINVDANKSGIQGGSGSTPSANPNTANSNTGMTAADRQAKRAERRAARKSRADGQMSGTNAGPVTATSGNAEAKPGASSRTLGQGQTSTPQTEGRPN